MTTGTLESHYSLSCEIHIKNGLLKRLCCDEAVYRSRAEFRIHVPNSIMSKYVLYEMCNNRILVLFDFRTYVQVYLFC